MTVALQTEWHDGMEFEKPTWDPTPVSWNASGSWTKDQAVTDRCRAGIVAVIGDVSEQLAEARAAEGGTGPLCRTYWGSHGCGLDAGHSGLCVCTPGEDVCSMGLKYGDSDTLVLWWNGGDEVSTHHWGWFT